MTGYRPVLFLSFLSLVTWAGCLDSAEPSPAIGGTTLAEVMEMIARSVDPDSDGDHLPDDVEAALGTDPNLVDTDRDGTPDFIEVFGADDYDGTRTVPNVDGDAAIAAADQDDNGDGINDGEQIDSDGDGISNYLEYYGYTYDWMTGSCRSWDGADYDVDYFKTDPHQSSTDQDPFADLVEVSGVNMDVSVAAPGDKPMVPAFPDILVRLEGYSVTLNQELTWTEGESLAEGTTWERTASASHSHTSERSWEIGVSTTVKVGLTDIGAETTYHANYGGRQGATSATSHSVSTGSSVLSEHNWSRASTTNPTDAAHIKLFLKLYNHGTAVASQVIPTLALKIGGHNIATFEPGNAQVNLIEPGGVYPSTPGVYWVVDSLDTGAGIAPIALSLGELKALESGAPVSVTVTQVAAQVMLKRHDTGAYESGGDWNEYMARIRAVSASLFFDIGDGNFIRTFVFAGDSLTAPAVTFGDALMWAAQGRRDTVTGEVLIRYRDDALDSLVETSLDGWHIATDGVTYEANGFAAGSPPPADTNLADLRLLPGSVVVAKAPRASVPDADVVPAIHFAYFDPVTAKVTAVVSDYNGIASVEMIDKDGAARAMAADIPGSSFYVYAPALDVASYPAGYLFDGSELIRATNVHGETSERQFIQVYSPPEPQPPRILSVSADLQLHTLTAHVESDLPLDAAPAFVRVYSEVFGPPSFGDGYCGMHRVSNWFEDPTGWICDLTPSWTDHSILAGMTVVAYAGPELLAYRAVTPGDALSHITGSGLLTAAAVDTETVWTNPTGEIFELVDLDSGAIGIYSGGFLPWDWQTTAVEESMWTRSRASGGFVAAFSVANHYLGIEGDSGVPSFDALTRGDIQALAPDLTQMQHDSQGVQARIFVYQTTQGRYGKLRLTRRSCYRNFEQYMGWFNNWHICPADYEFVTFLRPDETP